MLDTFRTHKRFMLVILVLLVFPAFVFMGVQGYEKMASGAAGDVAKVAGISISGTQLDNAYKREVSRILETNKSIDAQMLYTPEFKRVVLDSLIQRQLNYLTVMDGKLLVSDYALREALNKSPELAQFRKPDGSFDHNAYVETLRRNNTKPQEFEDGMRQQIMTERLASAVSTGIVPQADVEQLVQILGEKFVIRQQLFMPEQFIAEVKLTPEQLKAYYDQNASSFLAPEQVNVEYVILDAQEFADKVTVSEEQARAYYEQNKKQYVLPEQRRASHILIAVDENATPEQKIQALEKAQQISEQVRQNPSKFAEIAKTNSADASSAIKGGDLGFFVTGVMEQPFEDAVYAMTQEGEIAEVATSQGYHIIMLTGLKPASNDAVAFEDVRAQIENALRIQVANQQFAKLAEEFREDVYVNRNDLAFVAQKYELPLQTAENVTSFPQAGATGVLASPPFLTAIFQPQARDTHQNIQAFEISPTQLVSARVVSYTPPKALPYEEVESQVKVLAVQAKALELAQEAGRKALAQWQESPNAAQKAAQLTVNRQKAQGIPPEIGLEVFKLSSQTQLPRTIGIEMSAGGYALVQVERIEPADAVDEFTRAQIQAWLMRQTVDAQESAFMAYLENKYDVKIYPDAIKASDNNDINR